MKKQLKLSYPIIILGLFITITLIYQLSNRGTDSDSLLPSVVAKTQNKMTKLPDFSQYVDVSEKKETFFTTLDPIIQYENQHILKVRQAAFKLQQINADERSSDQQNGWRKWHSTIKSRLLGQTTTFLNNYF